MKYWFKVLIVITLVSLVSGVGCSFAADPGPGKNNGVKFRIGYMEGGPYGDYQEILIILVKKLMASGWIPEQEVPALPDTKHTDILWEWLAAPERSPYLEFVADGYWSGGWDRDRHKGQLQEIYARLEKKKDIDLMLAFGTWAGKGMATDAHSTPTMVCSVSDPVRSGIVPSPDNAGRDYIHTRVDPERYARQIRLFYETVGFTKLGVAYRDTPSGRTYAALEDIKKVSAEKGFGLSECTLPENSQSTLDKDYELLLACHQKLAREVDGFYLSVNALVTMERMPELIAPFLEHQVPTFAQGRNLEVKHGVMMGMAQVSFDGLGEFYAQAFGRILNGEKPGDISMIYEDQPEIVVNLETAKKVGFHMPVEILSGAKEVYQSTAVAPTKE